MLRRKKPLAGQKVYALAGVCLGLAFQPCAYAQADRAIETTADVTSNETPNDQPAADTVNESPRERGRVLLKRNPIASEYAGAGQLGLAPGAGSDAEGVDYRGFFPLPSIEAVQARSTAEFGLIFQGGAQKLTPQAALSTAVLFGADDRTSVQISARRSASERIIEHYQSAWRPREILLADPSAPTVVIDRIQSDFYLERARYSQDFFETTNDQLRWRLDHRLSGHLRIGYEGLYAQYDDDFYRNRMEHRFFHFDEDYTDTVFTNSSVLDESITPDGIDELDLQGASIRRYFGSTVTARKWHRHLLDLAWETDNQSLTLSGYFGDWNNQPITDGWNFYDRGIDLGYDLANPYQPVIKVLDGTDLQDTSASEFSDYQIYFTDTTDKDYAGRVDFDQRWSITGQPIWVSVGLLHRTKERVNDYEQEIYGASSNPFFLDAVDQDKPGGLIVKNAYDLPKGIDPARGAAFFEQNRTSDFAFNESVSILSSARNRYTTEETVDAGYLLAYQRVGQWRWEFGLRQEWTKTATKGIITGDFDNLAAQDGEFLDTIQVAGVDYDVSSGVHGTFIKEAVGKNAYDHLLPSFSLRFDPEKRWAWRTAYYQLMMRPQYFDIVSYRRIQHPTTSISEGNPNLAPTLIDNFITAFDWDGDHLGKWSVEFYYTKIKDFFYNTTTFEDVFNPLSGNLEQYTARRIENGDSAWIRGLQLQWSDDWEAPLPGVDSLEVTAAYTYSESEATFDQPDEKAVIVSVTTQLPERTRHLLNLNAAAKMGKWTYDTSLAFIGRTLDDLGESRARDNFREKVLAWDNSVSFRYSDLWQASLALSNILDHPERSYEGAPLRVGQNQYSAYILRGSIRVTF